jgi:hypothetical protein
MGRLDEAREIIRRLRAITPAVMEPATRYRNPELRELVSRRSGMSQTRRLAAILAVDVCGILAPDGRR